MSSSKVRTWRPDDVEELLAGEREVLAQAAVDGDAGLLQLV